MSKVIRKCQLPGCHNTFEVIPSKLHRNKYCCPEHAHESYKKRIVLSCLYCGQEFTRRPSEITGGRGKFCCVEHSNLYKIGRRTKRQSIYCLWCGKEVQVVQARIKNGKAKFCSHSCRQKYTLRKYIGYEQLKPEAEFIAWTDGIRWLVGIIASDGCLVEGRSSFVITSKDYDMLLQVQEIVYEDITGRLYSITEHRKDSSIWYSLHFSSDLFYKFCFDLGLRPNKSKDIGPLAIPDEVFPRFLSGEIDGDGCVKPRIVSGKRYLRVRIVSGSRKYLEWILEKCELIIGVRGGGLSQVSQKRSCWELSFSHYDSIRIVNSIYRDAFYYLSRKKNECAEYLR